MKIKKNLRDNLTRGLIFCTAATIMCLQPIVTIYYNSTSKPLGKGLHFVEMGNTRRFYDETNRHIYFDYGKDGKLDSTCVNRPVGPFMGGPGYRLFEVKTTEEDKKRFERANTLLGK